MEFDCKLFFFTKVVKKHASTIWNKVEVAPLEWDHPPWIKPFKNNYHCRTPVKAEGLLQSVGHWVQPFITHSSSRYVRQEWGKLMGVPFILTVKLLESHKQTYESVSVFVCDILEIHIIRWNVVLQLSVWVNMLYFCLSIVFNQWTHIYASYIHIYTHQILHNVQGVFWRGLLPMYLTFTICYLLKDQFFLICAISVYTVTTKVLGFGSKNLILKTTLLLLPLIKYVFSLHFMKALVVLH